ncbi:4533_t:CDS:2 [Funneliformis geosporum]|uniref:7810_t:CDS:1 n=1 Tax=Funneliformis geosporum TaxID=1117311 RepID=A0A9W4SPB5_9GLOM|nr:4533_t:CDS:2 [Funneliformis geosporum]CAI2176720.1 7810_t:CDS:2 [Funneliformis geosporum]
MSLNNDWYDNIITENGILNIPYEQISNERKRIGFGRYGIVYKTTCNWIEGDVAVKEVYVRSENYRECIENFINEVKIHNRARNKRIIQLYGISRNREKKLYYIVIEYANDGTLCDYINKKDLKERIRLATQISEGLSYLHNKLNISHRDLHMRNILVKDGNIKISDFGMSKGLDDKNKSFGLLPTFKSWKLSAFALDKVSDIYSLGVILLKLSNCRRTLFPKEQTRKREKTTMTSILKELQFKPLEPVYLSTIKRNHHIDIQF